MIKHRTVLFAWLFCAAIPTASLAREAGIADILGNLGNAGTNGQPNLSFDIVSNPDAAELKRLGFSFKLSHQVNLAYGGKAKSDWRMPALKTAVCLDGQGDLIWLHPSGRLVRFKKTDAGFSKGADGSTAKVSSDGNDVEIITARAARWLFRGGFVESARTGRDSYSFKTNRETILAIGRNDTSEALLEIQYSDAGQLAELVFSDGKKCVFQWDPDDRLRHVYDDAGRRIDFDYDNRLLKSCRVDGGPLQEFKWEPFGTMLRLVLGRSPVVLGEDSSYEYRWEEKESLVVLNIFRKSGGWVSRTSFSTDGIMQQTPQGTLRHAIR